MKRSFRLAKNLSKLFFPIVVLLIGAVLAASVWLVYKAAHPTSSQYLMTPDKFGLLSARAAQTSDEKWTSPNGEPARGWLLKGNDGAPAVILLHKYGADRSYVLNLGVKLNESTGFTVLMPDLCGHGPDPLIERSTLNGCDLDELNGAMTFLKGQKSSAGAQLIGPNVGVYGVELGALDAISLAAADPSVKAVAADSVPEDANAVLDGVIRRRYPFANELTTRLARLGTFLYFFNGGYDRSTACEMAHRVRATDVLMLSGVESPDLSASTMAVSKCFPAGTKLDTKFDLSPSGVNITNASIEQSEGYDQRVIDFFRASLGG